MKTFDCVEMKRQAQAKLMAEYQSRRGEFDSFGDFIRKTAEADPEIQELKRLIEQTKRTVRTRH